MYSIRSLLLLCWYKYSNIYDPPARCCSRARLKRRRGGAPPRIWASGQVILHQQRAEAGRDDANTTRMQCIYVYSVVFDVYSSDVRAPCRICVFDAYWMCIVCASSSNTCISRGAGANESNTSKYMYLCIFWRIHDVLVTMTEYMLKCIVNTLIRYQILMSPPLQLSTTLIHRNTL